MGRRSPLWQRYIAYQRKKRLTTPKQLHTPNKEALRMYASHVRRGLDLPPSKDDAPRGYVMQAERIQKVIQYHTIRMGTWAERGRIFSVYLRWANNEYFFIEECLGIYMQSVTYYSREEAEIAFWHYINNGNESMAIAWLKLVSSL